MASVDHLSSIPGLPIWQIFGCMLLNTEFAKWQVDWRLACKFLQVVGVDVGDGMSFHGSVGIMEDTLSKQSFLSSCVGDSLGLVSLQPGTYQIDMLVCVDEPRSCWDSETSVTFGVAPNVGGIHDSSDDDIVLSQGQSGT